MRIELELRDSDAQLIQQLLDSYGAGDLGSTHGRLDIAKLASLLLEDVALAWCRPGSWEGANMTQVLAGHGYGN